jgi:CHAD domain-containing protein
MMETIKTTNLNLELENLLHDFRGTLRRHRYLLEDFQLTSDRGLKLDEELFQKMKVELQRALPLWEKIVEIERNRHQS